MSSPFSQLRTLALGLVSVAACDSDGPFDRPDSMPQPVAAQGASQVIVTNTAANAVKTEAVGTTSIAGTVAATQAGAWSVHVDNATLPVQGSVAVSGGSIAATQAGAWGVTVTEPVAIAPGASVAVSALPPVTIAGTPQVTVAGIPTVALAGTPPVTIAGAAQALPVTGAVEVANLPAVQEVSGTVDIAAPDRRSGAVFVNADSTGYERLPAGLVLTDITFWLAGADAGECYARLVEITAAGSASPLGGRWPLTAERPVVEWHLETGISARPFAGTPTVLGFGRGGNFCAMDVLWSGYVP